MLLSEKNRQEGTIMRFSGKNSIEELLISVSSRKHHRQITYGFFSRKEHDEIRDQDGNVLKSALRLKKRKKLFF